MKKKEKEELLKERLIGLKGNLRIAEICIKSALENLNNLNDFVYLINNLDKYEDLFQNEAE